uniref:Uncharacterized protein n=1 Tax=Arundo donax TaxID=35708 RepID=A0A0A9H2B0_ARUDO
MESIDGGAMSVAASCGYTQEACSRLAILESS